MRPMLDENTGTNLELIGTKFYSEGTIWLDIPHNSINHGEGYRNRVEAIIVGAVRTARVENLDKKDNFVMKGETAWKSKGHTLYIHAAPLDIRTNVLISEDEESRHFGTVFRFPVKFKIAYQDGWHNGLEIWHTERTERTAFGKDVDKLGQYLTLDGMEDISSVAKLLNLYNISRKTTPQCVLVSEEGGQPTMTLSVDTAVKAIKEKAAYREFNGSTAERIVIVVRRQFRESNPENWQGKIITGKY